MAVKGEDEDCAGLWLYIYYECSFTVCHGEKVLFQDSQNLGSQGSLDM
jgi:hypothetical protein